MTQGKIKLVRFLIPAVTLGMAAARIVYPSINIDGITLALIGIALAPWLAPLIKTLELPGGVKIQLQDLQRASARAESMGLLAPPEETPPEGEAAVQSIAHQDPNLALAGFRIEVEKRLKRLASAHGLPAWNMDAEQLLQCLSEKSVLKPEENSVLRDMINGVSAAVHGAKVDTRAADWALNVGPRLLKALDNRLHKPDKN
jgi:hypothetical protein